MCIEKLGPIETEIFIDGYIDSNNHLNNAAWCLLMEQEQKKAAAELGLVVKKPLQYMLIKYLKQIFAGDKINVIAFANHHDDVIQFDQTMQRKGDLVGSSLSRYSGFAATEESIGNPLLEVSQVLKSVFPSTEDYLNPATALYYFERARLKLLSVKGISGRQMREKEGMSFMVTTVEAQYGQYMHKGDEVLMRTAFDHYRSQFKFHQEMIRDGLVINRAKIVCGLVDRNGNLIRNSEILDPIKQTILAGY